MSETPFCFGTAGEPVKRLVTQCALSRICAMCGESLDRPLVLVGTTEESDRNEFRVPPVHDSCSAAMARALGAEVVVHTGGFEFVRPSREALDPRPVVVPNSVSWRGTVEL